jgi:hypothetical protein
VVKAGVVGFIEEKVPKPNAKMIKLAEVSGVSG